MGRRGETPLETEENGEGSNSGRTPRSSSKRKSLKEIDEESEDEVVTPSKKRKAPKDDVENGSDDKVEEQDEADSEASDDEEKSASTSTSKKKKTGKKSQLKGDADESGNEENEKPLPRTSGRKQKEPPAEEEDPEYEVEKIVDDRAIKGRIQYKIRWKGYQSEDDTWENESTLDCNELIEEYNDAKGEEGRPNGSSGKEAAKSPKSRGRPPKAVAKKGKNQKPASTEKKTGGDKKHGGGPDPNGEWEVLRLIDMHTLKNGKREFLVRWKGYPPEDDSWEPEEHLKGTDLLEKFLKKVEQTAQTSRSGSRRTAKVNYNDDAEEENEPEEYPVTPRRRGRQGNSNGHSDTAIGGVTLADVEKCLNAVIDNKRLAREDKLNKLVEAVNELRKENRALRQIVEAMQSKLPS